MRKNNLLSLIFVALISACSTERVNENSPPEKLLTAAEQDISGKQYLQAIERLKLIKNKHPYSKEALLAKLRLADVYYSQESWSEASASYDAFVELHPKHEKVPYAVFKSAEALYNDMPGTIDRDLTPVQNALEKYLEIQKKYSSSEYIQTTVTRIKECNDLLAQKEEYIGDYYTRKSAYNSAILRYKELVDKYKDYKNFNEVYLKLAKTLIKAGKMDEAKVTAQAFINKHSNAENIKEFESILKNL